MNARRALQFLLLAVLPACAWACTTGGAAPPRNVILFVADGLRAGSVNATDTPNILRVCREGVRFANSHSHFPTFTMPNASALATGHALGDTGIRSNTMLFGAAILDDGVAGAGTPPLLNLGEDTRVFAELEADVHGGLLADTTLLAAARVRGYATAAVGKMGPVSLQDPAGLRTLDGALAAPATVILDDLTGSPNGLPLAPEVAAALKAAGLPVVTPLRKQSAGDALQPGTKNANVEQQLWYGKVVTQALLPLFRKQGRPFVLVYWSRDPDACQHNHGDGPNALEPGINGPTSRLGVRNADASLGQLLAALDADPALRANTDVLITSDHGFSTVSKLAVDAQGTVSDSQSARFVYLTETGEPDPRVRAGQLPPGFLALDLARELGLPLFDPDEPLERDGRRVAARVDPAIPRPTPDVRQRPSKGNGLIGGTGRLDGPCDADLVVAANGGSDLVWLPRHDRALLREVVAFLASRNDVGALFTDRSFGDVPGALSLDLIGLAGTGRLPPPALVVAFKNFLLREGDLQSAVQIADTQLQQGQGMHGSFGRSDTLNFMAAMGPDFRSEPQGFVSEAPASNADLACTLAWLLDLPLRGPGRNEGRVLHEALVGGRGAPDVEAFERRSRETPSGRVTLLRGQRAGGVVYLDSAELTDPDER